MTRRQLVVWSIVGAIFASRGLLCAQSAGLPATVNEARAVAVLATDSIRLQLPLENLAGSGVRAVASVMSPAGIRSGETSVDLTEGMRVARFTLPWFRDEKHIPITEIGWYRIVYRVEAANATPANGVLSIGAIATNLLTLRMALLDRLIAGKPLMVRIYAGNPVTRKAFRGVHLQATLKYDGEPNKMPSLLAEWSFARLRWDREADLTYPIQGAQAIQQPSP